MKSWSSPSLPSPVPGTRAILTAYDTASGAVVPIGPASGTARLYVCGITPYDATHMGHAFTYVTFDLLNRAWRDAGLDVAYTQNVTDVDDPLLERATATGVDWIQLAEDQTDLFRQDMTGLRVISPKTYAGAVESIPEVIALIQRLAHAGYVYQVDDESPDWFFTTDRAEGFGDVSSYDRDQMLEVSPSVSSAMAVHSMCQPGRPLPNGLSQDGSPSRAIRHTRQSSASRLPTRSGSPPRSAKTSSIWSRSYEDTSPNPSARSVVKYQSAYSSSTW